MPRRLTLGLLAGVPLVALAAAIAFAVRSPGLPALLPAPTSPAVPDLAMAPLTEFSASAAVVSGEQYVAFTAAVANVGSGAFMVHAARADTRGGWRVSQRFDEPDGSTSEEVTPGTIVWGGHGHNHWHVQLGASYWLTHVDSSEPLRRYEKVGFCYFDQRPLVDRSPTSPSRPADSRSARRWPRSSTLERDSWYRLTRTAPTCMSAKASSASSP